MPASKIKFILPILILLVLLTVSWIIYQNPPSVKRGKPKTPTMGVEVETVKLSDMTLFVESYGTIKPRTQSTLLPQVSGQITKISPAFREGGFFEKGKILVQLDKRDLQAEVKIAQATLLTAKQVLSEENARAQQAGVNWKRLGNKQKAPDLVLRKPQLQAAKAQVLSAEANLDKAKLALERSSIIAPYTGRILSKSVDLGQVVSSNTELAKIYAVDYVEIRLPIKNKDLPYINLPESGRYGDKKSDYPNVTIISDLISYQQWQGKVVRTEGAFDTASQQLFVVAQIDDPYGTVSDTRAPLKIGQYVNAKIEGETLEDIIMIPNKAIYQNTYVYIVNDGQLERKNIQIEWQNEQFSILSQGLSVGQLLVTTPLGQVSSGTKARLLSVNGELVQGFNDSKKPMVNPRLKAFQNKQQGPKPLSSGVKP